MATKREIEQAIVALRNGQATKEQEEIVAKISRLTSSFNPLVQQAKQAFKGK